MKFFTVAVLLCVCSVNARILRDTSAHQQDPKGAGQPEDAMGAACAECNEHAPYLNKGGEDCVCHATDIMGTFADDSTKELTSAVEYGSTTENTGVARLPEGWMWHCRPVTGSDNMYGGKVWQQCPAASAGPS